MSERLVVDVAIAGGGILALAAACRLREAGLSVAVIEKRLCGAAASGTNFGGVRQQGRDLAELPLSMRARPMWDGLSARLGEDIEFEATGHIKLARTEGEVAELERYAEAARAFGLELTILGRNAVRAELPWLGETIAGGSLSPGDGQANPRVIGPAFARLARRMGVIVREETPVLSAIATGAGFEIAAAGDLTVTSRFLVNACGAGSNLIASAFGEPVPLTPQTPNMVVTEPLPRFLSRSIGIVGGDVYLRQTPRGNVIFGGGRGIYDSGDALARPSSVQSIGGMERTLRLAPNLRHAHVIRTWSGVDGQMPDQLPVIGPSSTTPGLIHAFGFSGHGFQLAPVIGEIVAELILDGASRSPLAPFTITRFKDWTGDATPQSAHTEH